MDIIQQHRKFHNLPGKTGTVCRKLAQLKALGQTNDEVFEVLKSLDLPLGLHMFITGHFTDLMQYFKPRGV